MSGTKQEVHQFPHLTHEIQMGGGKIQFILLLIKPFVTVESTIISTYVCSALRCPLCHTAVIYLPGRSPEADHGGRGGALGTGGDGRHSTRLLLPILF